MTTLGEAFTNNGFPKPVLKFKKLDPNAVTPEKAKGTDSGYDLVAISDPIFKDTYVEYLTGIAVEFPEGMDGELRARSSISKYDLVLCNGVGTIDNGYRGELKFRFKICQQPLILHIDGNHYNAGPAAGTLKLYKKGEKVGQLVLGKVSDAILEEVETLTESERGDGGFGHTGK